MMFDNGTLHDHLWLIFVHIKNKNIVKIKTIIMR